jgi:hypothetical protein
VEGVEEDENSYLQLQQEVALSLLSLREGEVEGEVEGEGEGEVEEGGESSWETIDTDNDLYTE